MSIFYRKSNNEGTIELYDKSLVYDVDMSNASYKNLKDFHFAEKYMYGRVDRRYVPIEVHTPSTALGYLNQVNKANGSHFSVLSFVAKAFNDLHQQFQIKCMSGHIAANDPYLSALEVQNAYTPPRTLYRDYSVGVHNAFIEHCRSNDLKMGTFGEYVIFLLDYIERIKRDTPFTYPAFIKSAKCPMTATGLVIEIATILADDDDAKIDQFKNSPNWEFYLNACRSYGFSVDLNAPWRMIADIGTPEMIQYSRSTAEASYLSTDSILALAYRPAHQRYYENFRLTLMRLYNKVKRPYTMRDYCQDGSTRTRVVIPEAYDEELYIQRYGDTFILQTYMKIRLMEEMECGLTAYEKERLQSDIVSLAALRGPAAAVDIFEIVIGQTYNYSGSLTDLWHRVMVRREEELDALSNT